MMTPDAERCLDLGRLAVKAREGQARAHAALNSEKLKEGLWAKVSPKHPASQNIPSFLFLWMDNWRN